MTKTVSQDTARDKIRAAVKAIVTANRKLGATDIVTQLVRVPAGQPGGGQTIGAAYVATGAGVSTPFRRNYLKRKLMALDAAAAGVTITMKTPRKSGQTVISVVKAA